MSRKPTLRAIVVGLALTLLALVSSPAFGSLDAPSPMASHKDAYPVTSTTRVQVSFVSDNAAVDTSIVRAGDAPEAPPAPTAPEGKVFSAWSVGTLDLTGYFGRELSAEDIATIASAGGAVEDAQRLCAVTATASFVDAYEVRFHQYTRVEGAGDDRLESTFAFSMLTDAAHSIDLSSASRSFTPVTEGTDARLVGWEAYAPGVVDTPSDSYDTDQTVTGVSSALELYPVLSKGFTVTLDTGSAPVVEALFVRDSGGGSGTLAFDRLPTAESLGSNFYPGYTFGGWFLRDEGRTQQVTDDITDIEKNMTLYAKWDPATTTYTVINMLEGPESKPGQGHYTFYSSEVVYGTTDSHIPVPEGGSYAYTIVEDDAGTTRDLSFNGYHLPDAEEVGVGTETVGGRSVSVNGRSGNEALSDVTVSGDGTTTVKLYWNRNRYEIVFKGNGDTVLATDKYVKYEQKVKDFEIGNSISNFLASYQSGRGRLIGAFEVGRYVIDSDGDMFLTDTLTTAGKRVENFPDKYSDTDWPENWLWNYSYYSIQYMKCMPGVDYSGKDVITKTVNGVTSNYYAFKYSIEVTRRANGVHNGSGSDHWTGGQAFGTDGYLYGVEVGNGLHYLSEGQGYWYGGVGLISNMYKGSYGCRLLYWPYSYTLSFANTIGSSVNSTLHEEANLSLEYGSLLGLNETLTKYEVGKTTRSAHGREYVFDGWYVDAAAAANYRQENRGDYKIDLATYTMPSANLALYAGWTPKTYPVTFDSVGGQMTSAKGATLSDDKSTLMFPKVEGGSTLARPETPTKTVDGVDYTFTGWYKDAAYTVPWDFATSTVQDETTLYAKWVKGRTYGVTYHREDGTEIERVDTNTYRYGARVNVAPLPASQAHDKPFLGWSLVRGNASRVVGQAFTISSNTDLFAVFGDAMPGAGAGDVEDGAPTVTLVSNLPVGAGGEEVRRTLQADRTNAAVTLPSSLDGASATGYHVGGWNTSPKGSGTGYGTGEVIAVPDDETLYAVWVANQLSATLDASFTYDGTAHEPEPTVTGWDGSALVSGADYELSYVSNVSAGTAGVTVTGKGEHSLSEPVTLHFQIAPRPVTIALPDRASRVDEPVAALGVEVTPPLVDPGHLGDIAPYTADAAGERASVDTSTARTYRILAGYDANPNYSVTVSEGTYTVSAATLLVTARGWSGTYDGQPHSAAVTLSPADSGATVYYALSPLDDGNYADSGSTEAPRLTDVGTTRVYYYIAGTGSYQPDPDDAVGSREVAIARAPLTVAARPKAVTYGDPAANDGVTYSGFVAGEGEGALGGLEPAYSHNTRADGTGEAYVAGSPAGTYYVIPSGPAEAGNYALSYRAGTLTVARRPLTVAWSDADSMPYTGSARTYAGATVAGLVGGDAVSLDATGATATHAGGYTATVTGLSGARASSYALPAGGLSHEWHITTAPNSATVAIDDWTYGATPAAPTAIAGFGADAATFEYADSADGEFAAGVPTTAGTHWVRATIPATPDYEGATSPARAFEVARRPVAITGVGAAGKVYDGTASAEPTGDATLAAVPGRAHSGPVAGDGLSVAAGAASFASAAAGTHEVAFSGWALAGADAANYELASQPAAVTAAISPRPLTVSAPSPTISYGDEPPAYAASFEGFADGEDASALSGELALSCAYARGMGAGEYPIVPSGVSSPNYDIAFEPGTLKVERAANSWVTPPSISGWVLGQAPSVPSAAAALGEVSLSYRPAAGGEWSGALPAAPGDYEMRASVAETGDWSGLEATVPFSVSYARASFDANSRLATGSTPDLTGAVGDAPAAPACGFGWEHHEFLGWNTAPDGTGDAFAPGDPVELGAEPRTLYAQWDPRGELAYDGNGATSGSVPPQPGSAGDAVTVAANGFARDGHDFAGWNTAADGSGTAYAPGDRIALSLGGDVLYAQWRAREQPAQGRPMFRLYNPNSGEHFYTERAAERDAVVASGWSYEGVGWVAPASGGEPVYRLYNPNAGDHHYTLDAGERDALVAVGWRYEGVGWRSDPRRGVRVWRQYNPNATAGAHNFTTSEAEHVFLCGAGWRGEGVAWYGVR